jgi:protein-disulfide isomerase
MNLRLALALGAAALALSGCQRGTDDAFGQKVRAYLLDNPEILVEVSQKLEQKRTAEAANLARAGYDKHKAALERDPRDLVANPNGAITVVEFYDYKCGYCKLVAPEIATLIRENPDVRFVFKEYPIFGGDSLLAAQVMASPAVRPKAIDLHQRLMAEKALDAAAIQRNLKAVGLNPRLVQVSAESEAVRQHLTDNHRLAEALGIQGTPHFIVGGTAVSGADMDALRLAIAKARAQLAPKTSTS